MRLSTSQNNLLRTPFYDIHKSLGAKIVPFAGYEMPLQYEGIKEEHLAVRNDAGIFDVSHMGEITIEGKNSIDFVNYLVSNKISGEQRATYTLMCNKKGGVVDDLLVYTLDENKFLLVVNASNIEKDYRWIKELATEVNFKGSISNDSNKYFQLAVQGPNSLSYLEKAFGQDVADVLKDIKFFRYKYLNIDGTELLFSRTGYTGEYGFEIYGQVNAVEIFNKILETGITPCGLGARDSLRLEASLPLYGHELGEHINPLETGLKPFIKLEKDFVGQEILKASFDKLENKLVGFTINSTDRKPVPRPDYKLVADNGEELGYVTSGAFSYVLDEPIGLAYVKNHHSENINIDIRGKLYPIKVVDLPFIKKKK